MGFDLKTKLWMQDKRPSLPSQRLVMLSLIIIMSCRDQLLSQSQSQMTLLHLTALELPQTGQRHVHVVSVFVSASGTDCRGCSQVAFNCHPAFAVFQRVNHVAAN